MLSAQAITVSQAIKLCNAVFTDLTFAIEGEISSYSISRGTFVFFDLKDEDQEARLSCFMMLHAQNIPLEDGMRVVITGRPSIHTKSGKFSITVQKVEPKGEGSVRRAFELLKQKLDKEGLFAPERKRSLPAYVQRVGVISSTDAAGYGDFMRIISTRLPGIALTVAHVAVQGKDAEEEICYAFDYLNSHSQLDVIVLIRGGGSIEDLHAFNSEPVARAIVRSRVPVLVGVGHERDSTIADFCADVRAATPSNAAQLLLPTTEEVHNTVIGLLQDGKRCVERAIGLQREEICNKVFLMHQSLQHSLQSVRQRVESLRNTIDAVSPQQTLSRGYSITYTSKGSIIRSAADVSVGDVITTQLCTETVTSRIE